MIKATSSRIFGLDLMRALAILMVLFGHCLWIYPERQDILYQSLQLFGFFGVELFFVLSGFLIGNILFKLFTKEEFTLKTALYFLKRRWYRTLPNYYLVLLINVLVAFLVGYNIPQLWRYFFFLQNFKAPMLPFFPESWSLSIEEFAYILLPGALIILGTVIKKVKSSVYLLAVITLIVLSFLAKINYTYATTNTTLNQWNVALKSVVIYRLDSIYIGVFASWIFCNFQDIWIKLKYVSYLLGLVLFFFLFFGLAQFGLLIESHPHFWNVLYLPLASICVALFLPILSLWKTEVPFIQKPIEFISRISYSIYLLHYSLILYLMKYFVDTTLYSKTERLLFTTIYLIIVFILSALLYRFYEKPMMDLRDKN